METNSRPEASSKAETYTSQGEEKSLIQRYTDVQANHQAELLDFASRQKSEVERLLGKHAGCERKVSGACGTNGV